MVSGCLKVILAIILLAVVFSLSPELSAVFAGLVILRLLK